MSDLGQIKDVRKVLLIKLRYIGDAVLVTPLLCSLKAALPHVSIDVLVSKVAEDILLKQPDIHMVYGFEKGSSSTVRLIRDLREQGYDMVIDLTNNDRSMLLTAASGARFRIGFSNRNRLLQRLAYSRIIHSDFGHIHTVDHHLRIAEEIGLPVTERHPTLYVSKNSSDKARQMLLSRGLDVEKDYVVIHHGARRWYKSWPHRSFAELADRIIEGYGLSVFFIGSKADRGPADKIIHEMRNDAVNLSGEIPLRYLPALLRAGVGLVGNDSAPIHVATAVNTPVVALFGPTDATVWGPRREHDVTISANFPCKPCGHKNLNCPLGQDYCMSTITVDEVWANVRRILDKGDENKSETGYLL